MEKCENAKTVSTLSTFTYPFLKLTDLQRDVFLDLWFLRRFAGITRHQP